MDQIVWDQSFSVGVGILDDQHKKIIRIINRLFSEPDVGVASEAISELLNDLLSYSREHFKTEEGLLEENGYPGLSAHMEAHKAYRIRAVEFCKDTMDHKSSVPGELKTFLHDWWVDHILKTDMQYSDFFNTCGVK